MKKFLSISLTILLAIVITYAGSGINAYSFCCEDCHTIGVEAVTGDKCCDIHHDDFSSKHDDAACDNSHDQCSLDRLDIDLQNVSTVKSQTQTYIKHLDVHFTTLFTSYNKVIQEDKTIIGFVTQSQKPPNLSKQIYFSLLEILII